MVKANIEILIFDADVLSDYAEGRLDKGETEAVEAYLRDHPHLRMSLAKPSKSRAGLAGGPEARPCARTPGDSSGKQDLIDAGRADD